MPIIRKMLDLSTAHLDDASQVWLYREGFKGSTYIGCNGFVTCCYPDPDNPGHTVPEIATPVLAAIFEWACSLGCDYILFDADGTVEDDLPVFGD